MGEVKFGLIKGVISTVPGFIGKVEVVEVSFDPRSLSYEQLVKEAVEAGCAVPVFTTTEKQQAVAAPIVEDRAMRTEERVSLDKEPKYYLSKTALNYLPMTGLQAVKINALLKKGGWKSYLSPCQRSALDYIEANSGAGWKSAIGKEFQAAWREMLSVKAKHEKRSE